MPSNNINVRRETATRFYRNRKENHICVKCKEPAVEGIIFCEFHRHNKNRYKNYARHLEWSRQYHKKTYTPKIKVPKQMTDDEKHERVEKARNRAKQRKHELKVELVEAGNSVFGKNCCVCNGNNRLLLHQINGITHPNTNGTIGTHRLALKNPTDFVKLCYPCHIGVHWCMNIFNMEWKDIKKLKTFS
jgi:hypothetical protein